VRFYKLEDVLRNEVTDYKTVQLPANLNGFRAIAYLGDSLIYGAPYGTDHIDLFKYSVHDEKLQEFVEYPDRYPLMLNEIKREVYGCYMAVKPDNTKFVRTFGDKSAIEIYDVADSSPAPISLSYEGFPSLEENLQLDESSKYIQHSADMKIFSWGVAANDHHIYTQIINSRYGNVADSSGPKQTFIPEIHVFDWEGNPVARYLLDHNFMNYAVDAEGRFLYTFSEFEEGIIRRYELIPLMF
jgi:hypothetical protein